MNQLLFLFILRLLSAIILITFLAVIAWLVYKDLRLSANAAQYQSANNYLRVIASEEGGLELDALVPLFPVTTIGRAQGNTIVIDDGYVSGEHLLITHRGKQWWLEDMGSRNGTLLNDLPLSDPAVISAGDVIGVGGTRLRVEL
jgi:hypothetical protein